MHIVVTGANGFVGSALIRRFQELGIPFTALVRARHTSLPTEKSWVPVADFFNWESLATSLPQNASTLVHLAARVHQPKDSDPSLYVRENVDLTKSIVAAAAKAHIKHIILVSTIKVYGEFCEEDFTVDSPCHPVSDYGKSKWQAEQEAKKLCREHNMRLDIIRIPLVVGMQAKGNLGALAKLLKLGFPLPFSGIQNRRSFLRLENLTSRIAELANARENIAGNEVWIHALAEPKPVTTVGLLSIFAEQKGFKIRSFPLPSFLLRFCCVLLDLLRGLPHSTTAGARSSDKLLGSAVLVPGSKKE